jgi:hypothetical protein
LPPPARTLGSLHHHGPGILSCRVPAHDLETVMKPLLRIIGLQGFIWPTGRIINNHH